MSHTSQPAFGRPTSYRTWDELSMRNAMEAIVKENMSIRKASVLYDVPRATLHDRISGRVQHGSLSGPRRYLDINEEEELVSFLLKCTRMGFPKTRNQVLGIVQQLIETKGMKVEVSGGWWDRFKQRHKHLSLRTAAALSISRAKATDPDTIKQYYNILESTLRDNNLIDKPALIFNCDETGLPLSPKAPKVIDQAKAKNPCYVTGNDKSQITVLACANAAGNSLPPFVIFDRKTLNPALAKGEVPGTIYGLSSKGWIDTGLFQDWFVGHFLCYAPPVRPLLLLLDGHSSHYSPEMIRFAAEQQVLLFVLPPHTTHLTQPLDKCCFASLKKNWKRICHAFVTKNPGRVVTRYDFSALFSEAWTQSMTMKNVMASFKMTGVYPFNPSVIPLPNEDEDFKSFKPVSLVEKTGLAYIPLYSPAGKESKSSSSSSVTEKKPEEQQSLNLNVYSQLRYGGPSKIKQLLIVPEHPSKLPTVHPKSSGRVLTSLENIQEIERKEEEKARKAREKEQRKKAREEKKKQKEDLKKKKGSKITFVTCL